MCREKTILSLNQGITLLLVYILDKRGVHEAFVCSVHKTFLLSLYFCEQVNVWNMLLVVVCSWNGKSIVYQKKCIPGTRTKIIGKV